MICVMILVSVTSSTLDSTVLPAAVCPDVEVLWFFVLLTDPVLCCVQGHRVLIVDSITLVMKKQHLGTRQRQAEEKSHKKYTTVQTVVLLLKPIQKH